MLHKIVLSFQHNCKKCKALKLKMCCNNHCHCCSHSGCYDDPNTHHCVNGAFQFLRALFLKPCRPSPFQSFRTIRSYITDEQTAQCLSADPFCLLTVSSNIFLSLSKDFFFNAQLNQVSMN